jgi:hypothetical protein
VRTWFRRTITVCTSVVAASTELVSNLTALVNAFLRDGVRYQPVTRPDSKRSRDDHPGGAAETPVFARIYDSVNAIRPRKPDLIATLNG